MNSGTMNELVSSGNILNFKGCYQRLIFIKFEGIWNMYSNENDLSVKWEFSKKYITSLFNLLTIWHT